MLTVRWFRQVVWPVSVLLKMSRVRSLLVEGVSFNVDFCLCVNEFGWTADSFQA